MTDYNKLTDFAIKDTYSSGNPLKITSGAEIDAEFDEIQVHSATKEDAANKGIADGYASLDSSTLVPVAQLPAATELNKGAAEIATQAEVDAGTDDVSFITALKLKTASFLLQTVLGIEGVKVTSTGSNEVTLELDLPTLTANSTLDDANDELIVYDASSTEHQRITVEELQATLRARQIETQANSGLAGGGDFTADRQLELDLDNLTSETDRPQKEDVLGIYDDSATAVRKIDMPNLKGIETDSTAASTYDLDGDDVNKLLIVTTADPSSTVLTINENEFTIGDWFSVLATDDGAVTLVPENGNVEIYSSGESASASRTLTENAFLTLIMYDTNKWVVLGPSATV